MNLVEKGTWRRGVLSFLWAQDKPLTPLFHFQWKVSDILMLPLDPPLGPTLQSFSAPKLLQTPLPTPNPIPSGLTQSQGSNRMASAQQPAEMSHLWQLPTDWEVAMTLAIQLPLVGWGTSLVCRSLLAPRHPKQHTQSC